MALHDRRILLRVALVAVLGAAMTLSACGRRGGLEAPPSAGVTGDPAAVQKSDEDTGPKKPDRRFVLDPLI